MCYLGAHQFGTTICEINLGSWHKGSRSTWWREKHQFCPTKIGPSRQPLQWDPLRLKLWTVTLNCGIDFRLGIHPCSGFFFLDSEEWSKTKSVSLLPQVGTSWYEPIYLIVPPEREKLGTGVPSRRACPWKIKLLEVLWLFFFPFQCFSLWGFVFLSSSLLYLLVTFQDCWASRHHGCWVHWWTFEIELHPLLRAADEVSEDVMRTGHYRSCCCQRSLPVEGLWTQVLLGLKVSCRYCSKHWKIAFPGFVFLAGFLGFGFSLFPPR